MTSLAFNSYSKAIHIPVDLRGQPIEYMATSVRHILYWLAPEVSTERISISQEETFARDIADPARLHDELRRMSEQLAEYLRARNQVARTVTTKVRYPDFAIRTRSTSLAVGIDDAERIGELACALLDRALRDRPGRLRLVGVGLSGLEEHVQLSLPAVV